MRVRIAAEAPANDRRCVHCGMPFEVAGVVDSQLLFCSASCVWAGDELRRATERRLRAEQRPRPRGLLAGLMGARRHDAALVAALAEAGASVRQIERYTAISRRRIERIAAGAERPGSAAADRRHAPAAPATEAGRG